MRFFEIASPQIEIVATRRFLKNLGSFLKGYPGVEKVLREFLAFKTANPKSQFGKKDTPFTGGPLVGQFHVHLHHGKVILVYGLKGGQIRLYDVVEHNDFERSGVQKLAAYIASVDGFEPFGFETETAKLSSEQKRELLDLFYEMSAQDRDILIAAANGDTRDLMEFCRLIVDVPEAVIASAFESEGGLLKVISTILQQTTAQLAEGATGLSRAPREALERFLRRGQLRI